MRLTSSAFEHGKKIPQKYACDGENVSIPLEFHDVPANAKTLVLLMDDPDIPQFAKEKYGIEKFDHWVVFNIPANTKHFAEGKIPPGITGINGGGKKSYMGPCPPDREHRYFFKLLALDSDLDLTGETNFQKVEHATKGHVIAEAKLMGLYEQHPTSRQ